MTLRINVLCLPVRRRVAAWAACAVTALWAAATCGGATQEVAGAGTDTDASAYDEIKLLTEVLLHVRKHYVDEKTYRDITYAALHGMLQGLDPHSDFLEPAAYESIQGETSGRFSGIGIHIGMREGVLTVIAPIEDTPAFRAGMQSGDRIVGIDGEKTTGFTLTEAVKRLRGEKGSEVKVTILRAGDEGPQDIEIVRDDIKVPSVKGTRFIADGIGYVRITTFSSQTAVSLIEEVDRLAAQDLRGLVLDLRSNPGGLLNAAVAVAESFLERGQLIVTTVGRDDDLSSDPRKASGEERFTGFPMAVLVNGGSASASEIVAGALRDNGRAVLVGDRTFGKASVQSIIRMKAEDGAAIRLTTAHYYTPSGEEIHDKGIEPDIVVEMTPAEWRDVQIRRAHVENPDFYSDEQKAEHEEVVDRQLERATDLLQGILIFQRERPGD